MRIWALGQAALAALSTMSKQITAEPLSLGHHGCTSTWGTACSCSIDSSELVGDPFSTRCVQWGKKGLPTEQRPTGFYNGGGQSANHKSKFVTNPRPNKVHRLCSRFASQAAAEVKRRLRAKAAASDDATSRSTSTSTMTKIKVIARVRPFLQHENVDHVVSVEEGVLVVKDLRTPGLVTRYPFVPAPAARGNPPYSDFVRDFAACYDHDCSHQALFEEEVEPLLDSVFKGVVRPLTHCVAFGCSSHPSEDCIRVLLWRQLVGKDYNHVRGQFRPRHYPSGGPGEARLL